MKILLKFKDGMVISTEDLDNAQFSGQGNFFELLLAGKSNPDAVVSVNDAMERKFADLYSFEIVLD